jgi:hypothetical protein
MLDCRRDQQAADHQRQLRFAISTFLETTSSANVKISTACVSDVLGASMEAVDPRALQAREMAQSAIAQVSHVAERACAGGAPVAMSATADCCTRHAQRTEVATPDEMRVAGAAAAGHSAQSASTPAGWGAFSSMWPGGVAETAWGRAGVRRGRPAARCEPAL